MSTEPCMGGWCTARTRCSHYLAGLGSDPEADGTDDIDERLCPADEARPVYIAVQVTQQPTGQRPVLRTQAHSRWPAASL